MYQLQYIHISMLKFAMQNKSKHIDQKKKTNQNILINREIFMGKARWDDIVDKKVISREYGKREVT